MIETLLTIALLASAAAGAAVVWRRQQQRRRISVAPNVTAKDWQAAKDASDSQVDQVLLSAARPLASMPVVSDLARSGQFTQLQKQLLASGSAFGGSVEIFLAVQLAAGLIGSGIALAAIVGVVHPLLALFLGAGIAMYPWNVVSKRAKKRSSEVTRALPDFANMLIMALSSGQTVLPSLDFTARRVDNIVSEEVRNLLAIQRAQAMPEEELFRLTAARLATPEAQQFFNTLLQGHTEGSRITDPLLKQAKNLRARAYQEQRRETLKMPQRLMLAFFLHVLPMILAITAVPALLNFQQIN